MPKRFFLTHSSKDKPLVLRVGRALTALGYMVWIDKFEIQAGDSLVTKIFEEGLQKTDYVCAFITNHSVRSKWVKEKLEFSFHRSIEEGKPKIVMLQFGEAKMPVFLKHRLYTKLKEFELGSVITAIMASARLQPMNDVKSITPYSTLDFHDAFSKDGATYILASRRDALDVEPFYDMEGIEFPMRHIFVVKIDALNKSVIAHYLAKARIAHTSLRVDEKELQIFFNAKMENNTFAMNGYTYRLLTDTLRPIAVDDIFANRNWGWDPWIDDNGLVHHKDSETPGNPYMVNQTLMPGKSWRDLSALQQEWRTANCPFATIAGPGRETGYLRFIDVDIKDFES